MAAEGGEDVQNEERVGLKRKPTGPPRLLLERTRTRSAGEDRSETKLTGNIEETSATCSDAPAQSEGELTCRGRQTAAGKRRRRRWWSRFSSAVVCIRRHEEDTGTMVSPPEGALQKHDGVLLKDREESRETDLKNMRNIFKKFFASPDVQQHPDLNRKSKSSPSFQTKLQKFFVRAGKRRTVLLGTMEDMKVEEDQHTSKLTELPDGHPEVQRFLLQTEHQDLAEEPESPTEIQDKDAEVGSEMIQSAHISQVLVQDVSSEEDEVLFDSELVVDLHHQPPFEFSSEEKMFQASRPSQPSTNRPSIRIELYPPDDISQEEEEDDECWEGVSSSENHLLHLLCYDHSERQLLQVAHSLVRTAVTAAVDQLTREQQSNGNSIHEEPQGCR
ncbi:hypothetical protein XENORESO_000841 [Xenotaenia resolanae]|uniref:Uncharacterized protein n=1 Tax=Xenotaenia resolanae TaxID=208358 RepID=A0ABV0VVN7_9TELE